MAGFTLLEVLVTVAIVVIVLGVAGEALIGTARSAPRTSLRAQEETELIRVESVLRRQLLTVATAADGTASVLGDRGTEPHADAISLVTGALLYGGGVGEAKWKIVHDPGEAPYLGYQESPYVGAEATGHHPWIPFSRLIKGMEVRYRSHGLWSDQWAQSGLPERIRLTLWFDTTGGPSSMDVEAVPGLEAESDLASPSPGASARPAPAPSATPAGASSPAPSSSPSGEFVPGGSSPPGPRSPPAGGL